MTAHGGSTYSGCGKKYRNGWEEGEGGEERERRRECGIWGDEGNGVGGMAGVVFVVCIFRKEGKGEMRKGGWEEGGGTAVGEWLPQTNAKKKQNQHQQQQQQEQHQQHQQQQHQQQHQ